MCVEDALKKRIVAYYEHLWLQTKGIDPDTLFNGLPFSLAGDVTLSLYSDAISKVSCLPIILDAVDQNAAPLNILK